MKRILLALAIGALAFPFAQQARCEEISIDFFYNHLAGGNWLEVGDYGYCWQPGVTVSDPEWRPYTDGYWAYTDFGWTWMSYEDFGWATYHYGRWIRLAGYGWLWVPGSDLDWGPAWVSWRVGADYVGWAPLPPRGPGVVYGGGPISGHVDIEFDIGPACYNFIDVRYFGEPVLRNRIIDVHQNVTYIDKTVNVTNITYENKTVYNHGPDLHFVEQHSSRPIQRLHIERQQNDDIGAAIKEGSVTKVRGQNLVVAAPLQIEKPAKPVAPAKVKTRIAQPKLERGWGEVGNEQARNELRQKIKNQNLEQIPPPTHDAGATAGSSATASPTTASSPFAKGRHGEKAGEQPSMPTRVNPPAAAVQSERGKHRMQGMNSPTGAPAGAAHQGRRQGGNKNETGSATPHP
jgi:hypothetical protein